MCSIQKLTVRTVADLMQATERTNSMFGDRVIYRGQTSVQWKLLPKAFRLFTPESERSCAQQFRREALTRHTKCPEHNDLAGWLCLMQHYGLPTRLLDWSLSPLVGTYFALTDAYNPGDAVVWCLSPQNLNDLEVQIPLLLQLASPAFLPLVGDAFDDIEVRVALRTKNIHDSGHNVTPEHNAFFFELESRLNDLTLAVYGSEIDIRMAAQQGYFTIHSCRKPLEEHKAAHQILVKCIIPSDAKPGLLRQLSALGIRESMLFPDLNGLARDVTDRVLTRQKQV
jgi:hypothetical protein